MQRVTLWCKVLGRLVEVVLVRDPHASPVPGAPAGWKVQDCLDRDADCFGKGCPFTMDGGEVPFGEVGGRPELPSERFNPLAEPDFEGEW